MKDEQAFYRGGTPKRDNHTYNIQKKEIQRQAERVLTKSFSMPKMAPAQDFKQEERKFYGVESPFNSNRLAVNRTLPDKDNVMQSVRPEI